jgi:SPP1 family phage portal protein
MKNRLDRDIHKFSHCPDMSDENFAGNSSGIAIQFKMLGTENLISIKERKFKKGLQQRLELMAQIQGLLGASFDWRAIDIIFKRNIPTDLSGLADIINKLSNIVSTETLLGQLPFVEDIQAELDRIKQEKEENKQDNPFLQDPTLGYKTDAMKDAEEMDEEPAD